MRPNFFQFLLRMNPILKRAVRDRCQVSSFTRTDSVANASKYAGPYNRAASVVTLISFSQLSTTVLL